MKPIYLDKELYLFIQPQTMSVGMMRAVLPGSSTNREVLEMTAIPRLVFGPKPPSLQAPMPAVCFQNRVPLASEATSNVYMDYGDANYEGRPLDQIDYNILA